MQLSTFIQILASSLGVVGSLFFAIGVIRQSADAMARLSGTYWDANLHMVAALAAQKADYIFGGSIIVFAFAAQLVSFLIPDHVLIFSNVISELVPWVVLGATPVLFLILRAASARLANRYERQIRQALEDAKQARKWERDAAVGANS